MGLKLEVVLSIYLFISIGIAVLAIYRFVELKDMNKQASIIETDVTNSITPILKKFDNLTEPFAQIEEYFENFTTKVQELTQDARNLVESAGQFRE